MKGETNHQQNYAYRSYSEALSLVSICLLRDLLMVQPFKGKVSF